MALTGHGTVYPLLTAQTATGAGSSVRPVGADRTFQAKGSTTSDSGSATVEIQVSNDNANWIVLGTITLTLSTTVATDGFASTAPWRYVRAEVTAISGTGASVDVLMGV